MIIKNIASKIVQPEQHTVRFFGTGWNSRLSLQWIRGPLLGKRGLYFHEGYVELYAGNFKIRYRNKKV